MTMYSGRGFREWEIGDIDIFKHGDTYHLFHLILPNHDYIAHATSRDCINWKRVKNALFVGDPGSWDDDMLWTMNVVQAGDGFEMYYTGLSQSEKGQLQRIGKAVSRDLLRWEKVNQPPFPIELNSPHYESQIENIRQWVSFRDPYVFEENGDTYLLTCARINDGCISRRGCVGLVRLENQRVIHETPLFVPRVYDDIECPCLVKLDGRYYLIGSIREDVKVHYWYCDEFRGEYHAFHNNVLMPKGNYAARITRDNGRSLLYSFFVAGKDVETSHRYFCPPKELTTDGAGKLKLISFHRWREKVTQVLEQREFPPILSLLSNPTASHDENSNHQFCCVSGYEVFCFRAPCENFIWSGKLRVLGLGKCGLVFNANEDGDGYYISLDTIQGYVQIRAWAKQPEDIYKDYQFENLQTNNFPPNADLEYHFELIRYGHYIELSIDGVVKLSLVDGRFAHPLIGLYCESAKLALSESSLSQLREAELDELIHFTHQQVSDNLEYEQMY